MSVWDGWPGFSVAGPDPRLSVVAEALHDARRPHLEDQQRHAFSRNRLVAMWPEYQHQIRMEAQAVLWAIDKFERGLQPPPASTGEK